MVTMKWPASRSPRIPVRDSPPSLSELWRAAFALRFAEGEDWALWSDLHRRLRVYETRPVAAEAQGRKMASTAGIAPATSTFARWRSDLTELRGRMASVIGLAPIRPGLKGRLRELLCIHGRKMVPE